MTVSQSDPVLIGLDIGTSSVKGLMTAPGGACLAAYSAPCQTTHPAAGGAEQDPADWMRHVAAALARFAAHPRAAQVAAIGVTSQVNSHVFCDARGRPLRPAITWQDTRAAAQAARLDAALTPEAKIAALGAPIPIDASHALSRMAWLAQVAPEVWQNTAHVLLPKDYVIAGLTGEIASDPISAVGLVGPDLAYAGAILDLWPGASAVLPRLADPLDIVGRVAAGHPFAGTPVALGTMDAWAGMFGLGVATDGQGFYLSGTSDVLGLISSHGTGAAGIVTFPEWRGLRLHAGPTQSGGASLEWLSQVVGQQVDALARLAGAAEVTAQGPLFLPHLQGERAPLWDSRSRGAFCGMTGATGPGDLVVAVMEGVAFSARMALEAVETSGAQTLHRLRYGGGGARSDAWSRIRATALGRSLDRVASSDVGAVGATVMAGAASGAMGNLSDATGALVSLDRSFDPDPTEAARMEDRYAAFCELYRALGNVNALIDPFRDDG